MDKNYCPNCSTENESDYAYCKNCGAQLKFETEETKSPKTEYSQPNPQNNLNFDGNGFNPKNGYDSIDYDGISAGEMSDYIGKNSHNIMPKLAKMQITKSKVSWCWPVAILSFLLGPLGAAIWFFYRKMYKPAAILTALGAVLTIVINLFSPSFSAETMEAFEDALLTSDIQSFITAFGSIPSSELVINYIFTLIEDAAYILTGVICGIYSYHWYKEQCISKIYEYRQMQTDIRYYHYGLTSIGGVSGGMLALGIIIYCSINTITSALASVINLIF